MVDAQDLYQENLERSKAILVEAGIAVPPSTGDAQPLRDELLKRGWSYKFAPGGRRYQVRAHKTWPPSASHAIPLDGQAQVEAFMRVLAEEYTWRAANGPYRTQRGIMYGDPK